MLINNHGKIVNTNELENYDKMIFYGASTRNKKVIDELKIQDKVLYFVDSNKKRWGELVDGYKVEPPCRLENENNILVITVLTRYAEEIMDIVRKYGDYECAFYLSEGSSIGNFAGITLENEETIEEITEKKYIHIFPEDKFVIPFYTMLEDCFNIQEHMFIIDRIPTLMHEQYAILEFCLKKNEKYHNIFIMRDFKGLQNIIADEINCNRIFTMRAIENLFDEAEKIVLHSAFLSGYAQQFIQSMIKKVYGQKMVWICWGGDSYFDADSFVVTEILQKIGNSYVIESGISRIGKNYKIRMMPMYNAPYCYISSKNKRKGENTESKNHIHVMLGHSAAEYGNHVYGLEKLHRYCSHNMRIYSPLSYGSDTYRDTVIEKGTELFGDKFIPMVNFMELKEYNTFLDTIDIAVFPMTRGAAGTTLAYLNSIGTKIYMNKEMIDIYKGFNIQAEDIKDIETQEWEKFIENKNEVKLQGVNDGVVSEWRRILSN